MKYIHHHIDDKRFKFVSDLDDIGHFEITDPELNGSGRKSRLKDKILMQEDGQTSAVLLIIMIILIVFLIVHFWGWVPIEHFISYVTKHLPIFPGS